MKQWYVYIKRIYLLKINLQTIRILGKLRAAWEDTRLKFPEKIKNYFLTLSPEILQQIWSPDLYIRHLQNLEITKVLNDNQGVTLLNTSLVFSSTR